MKCGLLLLVVFCTAASVAEDFITSSPPAAPSAEFQFSTPQVGTEELANTIQRTKPTKRPKTTKCPKTTKPTTATTAKPTTATTPKPTTTKKTTTTTTEKPTTTTPKPTTTTPKPTTTTPKPTTTTAKPTTTTPKPTPTTTPKPTPTTTPKPTPTTTPKPTPTTTPKPTPTTTPKPTTTTAKPIPTTAKPNSTTAQPTTTTTAKPEPPQPTKPGPLIMGKYNISKNGTVCLLAHMAVQIRIVSAKVNGTFTVQPNDTKTLGFCQQTTATLNLTFEQGFIMFNYEKNTTGNSVYVRGLSFSLFYPFSTPAVKYSPRNESLHLFPARIGHSYSCRSDSVYMGDGLFLDITQAQMQAFNFTANKEFDVSDVCPADAPSYSVAIAVGVVLLVLIVIVVVAYVVGRRRRASGYQAL